MFHSFIENDRGMCFDQMTITAAETTKKTFQEMECVCARIGLFEPLIQSIDKYVRCVRSIRFVIIELVIFML